MKSIRDIIGRALLILGVAFLIVPLNSVLRSEFKLGPALLSVLAGVILVFGGIVVLEPPGLEGRPRFWWPAVSGFICSVCTFLLFVNLFVVYRWPAARASDWLIFGMLFSSVVGSLAAVVCIVTGVRAFFASS
jgi:hypothetical protein